MSLTPKPELVIETKEPLLNPKTGKSRIQFTTFENVKRLYGVKPDSVIGKPGQQSRTVECSLTPNSVAKIGKGSDLFTEAVCVALFNDASTEVVVTPTTNVDIRNATDICVIVPRITGLSYEQKLEQIKRRRLRVKPEKFLTDELNTQSVGVIARAISKAERRRVVLNDIQKRQVVLNPEESKSDFVDFSAARIGWYDQQTLNSWITLLDEIGSNDSEVTKYSRDLVAKHLLKLTEELSHAQGGNKKNVVDLSQVDHEIVQWQAELLLRKTALNLPRGERTSLDRLAADIDYAKPPTTMNKIKDFIFGGYTTEEWNMLPGNIKKSIEIARAYLQESNLIAWMQEKPDDFAEAMLGVLKSSFLTFDNLSINRAYDIEGNGGWAEIKSSLRELATVKGLSRPTGERRREVIKKLKKEIIHLCVSSDRSVADGVTEDLQRLKEIMMRDKVPNTAVLADQIEYLCENRNELVARLLARSSEGEISIESYLELSETIKQSLNRITKMVEACTGGNLIRPLSPDMLDFARDLVDEAAL